MSEPRLTFSSTKAMPPAFYPQISAWISPALTAKPLGNRVSCGTPHLRHHENQRSINNRGMG